MKAVWWRKSLGFESSALRRGSHPPETVDMGSRFGYHARMVSLTEIVCAHCLQPSQRKTKEVKQAKRLGRTLYCSKKCSTEALRKAPRRITCQCCGKPFEVRYAGRPRKYCSKKCRDESIPAKRSGHTRRVKSYEEYILRWKQGLEAGLKGANGGISTHVRRYIFEKFGHHCVQCGWAEVHPVTKRIPLHVDHKDGDWRNTTEENLTLLCPNCHSLTETYGVLNKGRGRSRTWVERLEGESGGTGARLESDADV